jgi:hypothetical protein
MCGVLLRSGSRSLRQRFRHLARRTTTASLAKPLKWLGPNLLCRLSISSDGTAAQQLLVSVFGREMYISQWWLFYLSLESLGAVGDGSSERPLRAGGAVPLGSS